MDSEYISRLSRSRTARNCEPRGAAELIPSAIMWLGRDGDQVFGNAEAAVHAFNEAEFIRLLPDDDMRNKLFARLDESKFLAKSQAERQLQEVLSNERDGILQTVNHYFAENLSSIRQDRVTTRLKSMGLRDGSNYTVDLRALTKAAHLSNEEQAVNDIHDILKAYYKVALKRYMDNVLITVVERSFVGRNGPVKAFTPGFVGGLSDAELDNLAGEDFTTSSVRVDVNSKAARFKKALEIARSV